MNKQLYKLNRSKYAIIFVLCIFGYGLITAITATKINDWRQKKSQEYLQEAKNTDIEKEKLLLYEKSAVLKPSKETYLLAGISATKLKDYQLAEKYLSRVKSAEGYYQLSNVYYDLGEYEKAITYYKKSNSTAESARSYLGLGKCYLKVGNIESARPNIEKSVNLQATDEAVTLLNLISEKTDEDKRANIAVVAYNSLNNLGYPQAAEALLQQSAKNGYTTRDGLVTLANELFNKGDYQSSYDYLQQARVMDPYYPQIYKQLVIVCEKMGKTDEVFIYQDFYTQLTF
jgi:tetratricopeptide (TPR) repeat protein